MSALSTENHSRSAEDARKWAESEQLTDEEHAAWDYLCRMAEPYPRDKFIPPFRAPKGPTRTRGIVGARLDSVPGEREGYPTPAALWLLGDGIDKCVILDGSDDDAAIVAGALFCHETRSCLTVFRDGAKHDLRLIAQRWGLALDALGFKVDLLVNGGNLRALMVSKGKHRWYLVDWQSVTGRPAAELGDYVPKSAPQRVLDSNPAAATYLAACYVQYFIRRHFGTGLGVTISSTAVRAAARSLGEDVVKWRPLPLIVSMMRYGFGFRGGLVRGTRYRGTAIVADLNRAYTAALYGPLPLRSALGRCVSNGIERPGVYLCRLSSGAYQRVYCGAWDARSGTFSLGWHVVEAGDSLITVLCSAEFAGLRRAGFIVTGTIGHQFTRTFSLTSYVQQISKVTQAFGPTSPEGRLTKLIGNAVYGKFAAHPERKTVRLASVRPGLDWYAWVDSDGWPVEDVWEQCRTSYQWSQHIDIAATITARVRSWMLAGSAALSSVGVRTLAMHTDSLVVNGDPARALDVSQWRIGAWKIQAEDDDAYVVGPNCWTVGGKTVVPTHPAPSRQDVVTLFERASVETYTQQRGHPRPGGPLYVRRVKRISSPATLQ